MLGPATRLLWRSHNSIHLELGERAVVVERLPRHVVERVMSSAPRRRRSPAERTSASHDAHEDDPVTAGVLSELTNAGFLWERPVDREDPRFVAPTPRLSGELTALAHRHADRAATVLATRHRASVLVQGHPRVGTHLAALLAAAGIGRVRVASTGSAHLLHAVPGGLEPVDEGRSLDVATQNVIERHAPDVDTLALPADDLPDLTILVLDTPYDESRRAALHASGAAHLAITTSPAGGSVGPLVLPSLTSCLRCADLHRRDRDPAWSSLAAQLSVPRRHGALCDVASETIIAGTAAAQSLAYLDGDEVACIEGTIEFHPPDWRLRRRSRPAHPDCGCTAGHDET